MSEKKFKEAKGNLAFSQGLLDRIRGQNVAQSQEMAQQSPEMQQEQLQQPPQAPVEQPAPQTPQQVSQQMQPQEAPQPTSSEGESPVDLLAKSGESMQNAFRQITQAFSKTEEKKAKETQDLEKKFTTELKGLKENIRKIVEE